MVAVAASWRWPRAGGLAVLAGAAATASAALFSGAVEGMGLFALGVALMYAAPFAAAGCLALADAGSAPVGGGAAREEGQPA
jgi:hypothetical protein